MKKGSLIRSEHLVILKSGILDSTLNIIAIFGVLLNLFSALRFFNNDNIGVTYFIQSSIVFLFCLIAFFKKKIKHEIKVLVLFTLLCGVLITGLNSFGFVASAKIYIPIISLFIAFVTSTATAFFALLMFVLIYLVYGFNYSTGLLNYEVNVNDYVNHYSTWLVEISIIFLCALGMLIIGRKYDISLTESTVKLSEYKTSLEKKVAEKTESLKLTVRELEEKNQELSDALSDLKNAQEEINKLKKEEKHAFA